MRTSMEDDEREILHQVVGKGFLNGFINLHTIQSFLHFLEAQGSTSLLAIIQATKAWLAFLQTQPDILGSRRVIMHRVCECPYTTLY